MSCQTAPVGLVMTAIVRGRGGQRPLARAIEQALGRQAGLERLEPDREVAEARRLDRLDVELERALRLEHVDPAVGDDPQPGLGLERRREPLVAEPDALQLAALVLEGEVGVAGARDRDPADLALDPDVAQPRSSRTASRTARVTSLTPRIRSPTCRRQEASGGRARRSAPLGRRCPSSPPRRPIPRLSATDGERPVRAARGAGSAEARAAEPPAIVGRRACSGGG